MKKRASISETIAEFLKTKGQRGALLSEIYSAVKAKLGSDTRDSSIRGVLYAHLPGAKGSYRPTFQRVTAHDETRYTLLKERG